MGIRQIGAIRIWRPPLGGGAACLPWKEVRRREVWAPLAIRTRIEHRTCADGIDDQYGSLAAGKVADLVLYDGDPFEHSTHVTHTILGGRVIYDRGEYLKQPFERRALPLMGGGDFGCCLGEW